jgi:hypothetical protein
MMFTIDELKSILHYSPETGVFSAVVDRPRAKAGEEVGTILPNGYVHIMVRGKFCKGHRLAWFYMTGEWPSEQIDHINGERSDNRWCNLRECSNEQNSLNRRKYRNNSTSVTGVYWHKKSQRYAASIDFNRKRINLGYFDSVEAAAVVRRAAELKYFGEFARAA